MQGGDAMGQEIFLRLLQKTTVSTSGCWEHNGAPLQRGYRRMMIRYELDFVHRWAWRALHGPIPDQVNILHSCDNPPCWRPNHLEAGTQSKNIQDCWDRNRHPRTRPGAKLTPQQVRKIRDSNEPQVVLAVKYGVHRMTIADIRHRRTWQEVA